MFKKIIQTILRRKIVSGALALVVVFGSYFMLKGGTSVETRYVLAAIERGTIITSITGSGQVSTSDQIDIRPKTSGDVTYVGVKNGQEVRAGQLLVQLDSTDAKKAVEDAGIALKNAEIQFEKWLLNQNDDTDRLNKSIEDAHKNLERTYQNVFNSISSIFLDWPDTIDDLRDVLYEDNVGGSSQQNLGAYQDLVDDRYTSGEATHVYRAKTDFENAEATYRTNFNSYKALGYDPSNEEVEKLLDETIETAKLISFAVRSELNLLDFVANDLRRQDRNIPSQIISYQSTLSSYVNQINSNVTSLMNSQDSIDNSRETIVETQKDLEFSEKYNPYDLADQQNSIKQREAALSDAKNKLSDYNVYAPFAGVIAKVNVKRGDSVSGSTTIATLISQHQIVEISLNEIDIANVRVGQKATITFDSVEELTITGEILEVGLLGTVSQGVVTYDVTIGFDTQDERIKPGMSASAVIITDAKQNVVMIPNSAVKFAGGANYVEVPGDTSNASQLLANAANSTGVMLNSVPQQRMVELGLANDSFTEVLSGLQEGDVVIIRTVTATSSSQTTTQTNSLFPVGGSRGAGGGGNIRTFSR